LSYDIGIYAQLKPLTVTDALKRLMYCNLKRGFWVKRL